MKDRRQDIISHYKLTPLPVEGTYFASTYREGGGASSAIVGLYADDPQSLSCFHRLTRDEVWHFYDGDPFTLYLLHPDGRSEEVVMGRDFAAGQRVQFVVPAGVWQGGCICEGGDFSLYGCTVSPAFTNDCFEAGIAENLIKLYPNRREIIEKLNVNGDITQMPD